MSEKFSKRLDRIEEKLQPTKMKHLEEMTDLELLEILGYDHEPTDEELMERLSAIQERRKAGLKNAKLNQNPEVC